MERIDRYLKLNAAIANGDQWLTTTLEIIIASSLNHHNMVKIKRNSFFQKGKIITEKFSFDLDQAELCSFIRSKVTEENVKRCQRPFCKKKIV